MCPACGFDPLEPAPPPDPDAGVPYSEKYRSLTFAEDPDVRRINATQRVGRTRLLVAVALLAIVGLYGSMVMVNDARHRGTDTAGPQTRVITRP